MSCLSSRWAESQPRQRRFCLLFLASTSSLVARHLRPRSSLMPHPCKTVTAGKMISFPSFRLLLLARYKERQHCLSSRRSSRFSIRIMMYRPFSKSRASRRLTPQCVSSISRGRAIDRCKGVGGVGGVGVILGQKKMANHLYSRVQE